jgi:hypothetical protein
MLFTTHGRIIETAKSVGKQDAKRTTIETHINAMLSEFPWVHGDMAREVFKNTMLGMYDEGAVELRSEEMYIAAAGDHPEGLAPLPALPNFANGKEAPGGNAK